MIPILFFTLQEMYNKGVVYFDEGAYDKAESCFVNVLKEDTCSSEALNMLGLIYHKKGDFERAISYFKRGLECDSENISIYINISNTLRYMKRYDEAISYIEKGLEIDTVASLLQILGIVYDTQGRCRDAVLAFKRALDYDTLDAGLLYNLGIAYKHCGVRDSSLIYMRRAVILYYKKGDYLRGEFVGRELLKSDSTDGVVHFYLAEMYLEDGEYDRSLYHYRATSRYDRENIYALYRISFVYLLKGEREKSFQHLKIAMEKDLNYLYIDRYVDDIRKLDDNFKYFLRGYIMYRRKNFTMAKEFFRKFVENESDRRWKRRAREFLKEMEG